MATIPKGEPKLVVQAIRVRRSITLVGTDRGQFWINHQHTGYTSMMPLLFASLNTKSAGQVSTAYGSTHPESGDVNAEADWFQWPA
jgi:hypothetical protein